MGLYFWFLWRLFSIMHDAQPWMGWHLLKSCIWRLRTEDQICPKSFVWQKRWKTKLGFKTLKIKKFWMSKKRSDYFSIPHNLDDIIQMAYIIEPKTVRNTTLLVKMTLNLLSYTLLVTSVKNYLNMTWIWVLTILR